MTFERGLAGEITPFAAIAVFGFALVPVQNSVEWTGYALAAALAIAVLCVSVFAPWPKLPRGLRVVPSLLFLVAVALLRDAGGGAVAGVGALVLVPLAWQALHGTRWELVVVTACVCAFFIAPAVLVSGPEYPLSSWRVAVVFAAAAALVGVAVQNLVARVRDQADALAVRERDLEAIAALARTLSETADARQHICAAACDLSGAHFAVLLEGQSDGALAWTARAGLMLPGFTGTPTSPASWAMPACSAGEARLVTDPGKHPDVSPALFKAADRPAAMLFAPVRRGEKAVGVLVVGWPQPPSDPRRATGLVRLLATEAAFVIERADRLGRLTHIAFTDELTGLPNRRSWDRRLEEAIRDAESVCVAILDLDAFKAFNDDHGHQAGDRLLKEAAAAWRAELRQTDMLARYGGEEFTILIDGHDLHAARLIVDRLRAATPRGQSCSAGLARREHGEDAAALLGRADKALYEAKRTGRNRSLIANGAVASDG